MSEQKRSLKKTVEPEAPADDMTAFESSDSAYKGHNGYVDSSRMIPPSYEDVASQAPPVRQHSQEFGSLPQKQVAREDCKLQRHISFQDCNIHTVLRNDTDAELDALKVSQRQSRTLFGTLKTKAQQLHFSHLTPNKSPTKRTVKTSSRDTPEKCSGVHKATGSELPDSARSAGCSQNVENPSSKVGSGKENTADTQVKRSNIMDTFSQYSPSAFLRKRQLKLDLTIHKFGPGRHVDRNSNNLRYSQRELRLTSSKLLPTGRSGLQNLHHGRIPTKSPQKVPEVPPADETSGRQPTVDAPDFNDEHKEIAFCSALLQVSPQHGFTSPNRQPQNIERKSPRKTVEIYENPTPSVSPKASPSSLYFLKKDKEIQQPGGKAEMVTQTHFPIINPFERLRSMLCTAFRIYMPYLRHPVDACILSNNYFGIADYENGFVILNCVGDLIIRKSAPEDKNACSMTSCISQPKKLFVLVFHETTWKVNEYDSYHLARTIVSPVDLNIETWALRKLRSTACGGLYLMASGEGKTNIWRFMESSSETWDILSPENFKRGGYKDISTCWSENCRNDRFLNVLLCDGARSQLRIVSYAEDSANLFSEKVVRVRRVKSQEWIFQGPNLAVFDEHKDLLIYDGSGKIFLFDGDTYKCKKVVADMGKGEVCTMFTNNGWLYVLCRYKLCIEAFLYREFSETVI